MFKVLLRALSAQLALPAIVLAAGGGGHGGCKSFSELYAALPSGRTADVQAAAHRDLATPPLSRLEPSKIPRPKAPPSPSESAAALRKLLSDGPCVQPERPLDYAVRAGNLEATTFLLDNGADPSAFDGDNTPYTRCETFLYAGTRHEVAPDDARRLQAYALTIDRGGDVNPRNVRGKNALHECHSITFLSLLVTRGAKVDTGHIDQAIRDALAAMPQSDTAKRLNAYARVQFFVAHKAVPSEAVRATLRLPNCGYATQPEFSAVCAELNRLLGAVR